MDRTSTECGPEHLWKVHGRERDGWVIRTTQQLMHRSGRYKVPNLSPIEFSVSAELPIHPYILGVLIGDGALRHSISFSVPSGKQEILEEVKCLVGDEYSIHTTKHPSNPCPQYVITGGKRNMTTYRALVKQLGLDLYSRERFIPPAYLFSSVAARLELLRGLMDTDGSVTPRGSRNNTKGEYSRTSFATSSSRLAEDVAHLVRSLGGVAILRGRIRQDKGGKEAFAINIRIQECPFKLKYKADKWKAPTIDYGRTIKSIEYVGEAEQQCISVTSPDHLYITDNFIPTHNTAFAGTWPKPMLLIDINEEGTDTIRNVRGVKVISAASWDDIENLYWALGEGDHEYVSVVIDQVSAMQSLAIDKVRKDLNMPEDENLSQRSWGKVSGLMNTWLLNYRNLTSKGMNVCFIAHDRSHGGGDEDSEEQIAPSVGARVMPSVASAMNGMVGVIGNCFIRESYETSKTKVNGKLKVTKTRKVEYCMRVGPHAIYTTKIRHPKEVDTPDVIVDPTFEKMAAIVKGDFEE